MTTLVTRPEPQASDWAQALSAQGVAAQALPLIAIDGPTASGKGTLADAVAEAAPVPLALMAETRNR